MEAVKASESSGDYGNVVANRTENGSTAAANSHMVEKVGEMKRNSAEWMRLNQSNDPDKAAKMQAKDARNLEIAAELSAKYGALQVIQRLERPAPLDCLAHAYLAEFELLFRGHAVPLVDDLQGFGFVLIFLRLL